MANFADLSEPRSLRRADAWGRRPDDPDYGQAPPQSIVAPPPGMMPGGRPAPQRTMADLATEQRFARFAPRPGEFAQPGAFATPPSATPPAPPAAPDAPDTAPGWFGRDTQRANPGGPTGGATGLDSLTPPPAPTSNPLARPDRSLIESYGGFDFDKDYDLTKSAKGTFFYASAAGVQDERWKNSATSVAWFNQYIRPELEARGFTIDEVKGDKAFVHTAEDREGTWIDFVERIDGDNPKLSWQDYSYGNNGAKITGPPRPASATRSPTPTNTTMPVPPVYNNDGTVTARMTPDEWKLYETQRLGTFGVTGKARERATFADLGQGI